MILLRHHLKLPSLMGMKSIGIKNGRIRTTMTVIELTRMMLPPKTRMSKKEKSQKRRGTGKISYLTVKLPVPPARRTILPSFTRKRRDTIVNTLRRTVLTFARSYMMV